MSDVRAHVGTPTIAQFSGLTTPSACAPLVVDSATGLIYSLKTGDVVVLAGGGGTGTVTHTGALTANALVIGNGADDLKVTTTGTGVITALGVSVGSAGALVTFNGALGTPSSGTATNLTGTAAGLTAGTASAVAVGGITGLGSGVATWLATPSSSNLASAVTGETGSGALVFGTTPSFASTLGVGAATASTSGAGVSFPATQSASTDANTLDDYEEGTWTPTDGSGAGLSLTITDATYTKIGRLCFVRANITYPATADVSQAVIASFPFTNANNLNSAPCYTNSGVAVVGVVQAAATTMNLGNATTGAAVTNLQMTAKVLIFSSVYSV